MEHNDEALRDRFNQLTREFAHTMAGPGLHSVHLQTLLLNLYSTYVQICAHDTAARHARGDF